MAYKKAEYLLSSDEFSNYRIIRAIAWLFLLKGLIFLVFTYYALKDDAVNNKREFEPYLIFFALMWGISGVVGGTATLWGSRKLVILMYGGALPYVLFIPVGTFLSVLMMKGIREYLASVDKINNDPTAQFDDIIRRKVR